HTAECQRQAVDSQDRIHCRHACLPNHLFIVFWVTAECPCLPNERSVEQWTTERGPTSAEIPSAATQHGCAADSPGADRNNPPATPPPMTRGVRRLCGSASGASAVHKPSCPNSERRHQ